MSSTSYYKIEQDGTVKVVTKTEQEICLDTTIMAKFSADLALKSSLLMSAGILPEVPGLGNIGICMRKASITFTVRMAALPMRCAFVMKEGIMVPNFKRGNEDKEFSLTWEPPASMRLYLVMNFLVPMKLDVQFLLAMDPNGRHYRLPLSNLYEDARLCHGDYDYNGSTLIDCVSKAWLQFHKSRWQSDLVDRGTDSSGNSMKLFRYKPLEPSGFEQLKPTGDWETLSTRISTAFLLDNVVI
jgi:hypothetical protein